MTLRLLWPQWQGAGSSSIRELAPEFPFDVARRGYAVGSAVLAAVLPAGDGPTAAVPVAMDDAGLELRDGIEAKEVILTQLSRALEVIRRHDPARIVTLGGECAVSAASRCSADADQAQGRWRGPGASLAAQRACTQSHRTCHSRSLVGSPASSVLPLSVTLAPSWIHRSARPDLGRLKATLLPSTTDDPVAAPSSFGSHTTTPWAYPSGPYGVVR